MKTHISASLPFLIAAFFFSFPGKSCARGIPTEIISWGTNLQGQTYYPPPPLTNAVAISGGAAFGVALLDNGSVVAWGDNTYGQTNVPVGLSNVTAIATGDYHALALTSAGLVFAWGADTNSLRYLQRGQAIVPTGLSNVTAIAANGSQSVAMTSDGLVVPWGLETNRETIPNVVQVTASGYALLADRQLTNWIAASAPPGHGSAGEWGLTGLTNVTAIASGDSVDVFLRGDGSVVFDEPIFGPNHFTNIAAIFASGEDAFGLRSDGSLLDFRVSQPDPVDIATNLNVHCLAATTENQVKLALIDYRYPRIVEQPANVTNYSGQNVALSVVVDGLSPSYQWQFDGTNIAGATLPSLTFSNAPAAASGSYDVIISNSFSVFTSAVATLTVIAGPPLITAQPVSQSFLLRGGAAFSAAAKGPGPIQWQWQHDGVNIDSATNSTLVLTDLQSNDAGVYAAIASNPFGPTTSSNAALTLSATLAVSWDDSGLLAPPPSLVDAVAIAAGASHAVALRADGTVSVWGDNTFGQTNVPPGLSNVVAVAAGTDHTLALRRDGTVVAWGMNDYGQTNVPLSLSNVVAVAAGTLSSMALRNDGSIIVWGAYNGASETVPRWLGPAAGIAAGDFQLYALEKDGSLIAWIPALLSDPILFGVPSGLSNVVAVAGMYDAAVALKNDGTLLAWGDGYYGQTNVPSGLTNVVAVSAESYHGLALQDDGTVADWGSVTAAGINPPSSLSNVVAIAAGGSFSLALVNDGSPFVAQPPANLVVASGDPADFSIATRGRQPLSFQWSHNGTNLSGATNASLSFAATQSSDAGAYSVTVSNLYGTVSAAATLIVQTSAPVFLRSPASSPFLLRSALTLSAEVGGSEPQSFQWQFNGTNIIGATNLTLHISSASAGDAGSYVLVCSNAYGVTACAAAALTQARTLLVPWGDDYYGQTNIPPGLADLRVVRSDGNFNLALGLDGSLTSWGDAYDGETNVPPGLANVRDIAAGDYNGGAILSDGSVSLWGLASYGLTNVPVDLTNAVALAFNVTQAIALRSDGSLESWGQAAPPPLPPPGLSNVLAVAMGFAHGVALLDNGSVIAWGDNSYGQTNVPPGAADVVALAAGANHTVALRADGTVVVWGDGNEGETNVPPGLTNAVAVAAGGDFSAALRADGTMLGWGYQNGEETNIVLTESNIIGLAVGDNHGLALVNDGSPLVVRQPFNRTILNGSDAIMSCAAVGVPPLRYQWSLNGTNIAGATGASYRVQDASPVDAGTYTVTVTNVFGAITSSNAVLAVVPWPYFDPRFVSITPGGVSLRLAGLSGSRPVIVYASSNLIDWTAIYSNQPAGQSLDFQDNQATGSTLRFYRAEQR